MDVQNSGYPLQRMNTISMLFSHNLGIDADELIVYENAIVYGLQFRKYRSKADHSYRQSGKNV